MKKQRYIWVTLLPTLWLLVITMTAGWHKLFNANPKIGFLAHADKFKAALAQGELLAPAKTAVQMQQIIVNDYVNASLCAIFMAIVITMLLAALRVIHQAWQAEHSTVQEAELQLRGDEAPANA